MRVVTPPSRFPSRVVTDVAWVCGRIVQSITRYPQGILPSCWGQNSSQNNIFINLVASLECPGYLGNVFFVSRRAALWLQRDVDVSSRCRTEHYWTVAQVRRRCSRCMAENTGGEMMKSMDKCCSKAPSKINEKDLETLSCYDWICQLKGNSH